MLNKQLIKCNDEKGVEGKYGCLSVCVLISLKFFVECFLFMSVSFNGLRENNDVGRDIGWKRLNFMDQVLFINMERS